ncbi:MAG: hydrogenase 4 subunit F [Peptococcales bacterium]|jgi:hydrogenase-4 component F
MQALILLLIPLGIAAWTFLLREEKIQGKVHFTGALVTLFWGGFLVKNVFQSGPYWALGESIYVDSLSALIITVIIIVNFAVSLFIPDYLREEKNNGLITKKQTRLFYLLVNIFVTTMLSVVVVNNLGLMWVAIEATTLASALLVGFYDHKYSLEAAWKYILLCTVGITFGLLGTVFTYYSAMSVLGHAGDALHWTKLVSIAPILDPSIIKIAFIFILVGYGTKMGLAPMHNWLPDAHSQAPTPVSALLSAVLLNCALYGIIRFYTISKITLDNTFSNQLLIIFGLISLGIAVPFILLQEDVKRLLAYSSVEHMGIIALGLGIGTKLAIFGAVLHLFNHAMAKSLFFMAVGSISQHFKTREIPKIHGIAKVMPKTVVFLLVGAFAVTGLPPFSIFLSEFTIGRATFQAGHYLVGTLYLIFIALIFAGLGFHIVNMAFGPGPKELVIKNENPVMLTAMAIPLVFVVGLGFSLPDFVIEIIEQVVAVIGKGIA